MGQTNYIVAIELSSSKVTGAAGIETHNGMKIIAAASTRVDDFISKGIVCNVDKASEAISNIVNSLEMSLIEEAGEDITIKKTYVSLSGLTLQSIHSSITHNFGTHTKITADHINELAIKNDSTFQIPEGYVKVQVITQEYKTDGKVNRDPIGAPAMILEGHYLNIIIKKQFLDQLCESFRMAKTEIADSFIAARMDADIILTKDDRRNGCALVNIGADTTTVAVYNKDHLRKLAVIPFGSRNITRDMCSEKISFDEAEAIKMGRGYRSKTVENNPIDNETVNDIIAGRMSEILQNVKYQINGAEEPINNIIFTGGGSRLKNMKLLLEEYLPDFKTSILSDPKLTFECAPRVNSIGIFTTALYGLLNQGKENCCEIVRQTPPPLNGQLFGNETIENDAPHKEVPEKKEEKYVPKEPEKKKDKKKDKKKETKSTPLFGDLFGNFRDTVHGLIKTATSEDPEQDTDNDE